MPACQDHYMRCLACHQALCSGDCFATHRDQYGCHNPRCKNHRSFPRLPEPSSADDNTEPAPQQQQPAEPATATATTTTIYTADQEPQGSSAASDVATATPAAAPDASRTANTAPRPTVSVLRSSASEDSFNNLLYRETITREYRLIDGQVVRPRLPHHHAQIATDDATGVGGVTVPVTDADASIRHDQLLKKIQALEQRLADLEDTRRSSTTSPVPSVDANGNSSDVPAGPSSPGQDPQGSSSPGAQRSSSPDHQTSPPPE